MTTPTATLGKLDEFTPGEGSFTAYLKRTQIFFTANGIAEDKQVPMLQYSPGSPHTGKSDIAVFRGHNRHPQGPFRAEVRDSGRTLSLS